MGMHVGRERERMLSAASVQDWKRKIANVTGRERVGTCQFTEKWTRISGAQPRLVVTTFNS